MHSSRKVLMATQPERPRVLLFYQTALAACVIALLLMTYSRSAAESRATVQHGTVEAGGMLRYHPNRPQQPPCTTNINYISSAFEQSWLDNVATWQNTFCEAIKAPQQQAWTKVWLDTLKGEASGQQVTYDPAVFSRFVTTTTCPGKQAREITTWIEPLAHGLRHPHALCGMGADIMDMTYLLIANGSSVAAQRTAAYPPGSAPCSNRTCQSIYVDLGATRWEAAPTIAGQGWFVRNYQARGIDMDRLLLWEAKPVNPPSQIFAQLPKELFHRYQYFNIPAITDYNDISHPVRMLKALAQPSDFVVFKLDIDNAAAEYDILKVLMEDPAAHVLVDEFFLEFHVNFQPMHRDWVTFDEKKTLADAFLLFLGLRQKGWRAHSWV